MSSPTPRLRPGDQLASTVCTARVIVVRTPEDGGPVVSCGGSPMVPAASVEKPQVPDAEATTLVGKRYVDADGTLELICTCSGTGELSCDGVPMTLKTAKPLPASD